MLLAVSEEEEKHFLQLCFVDRSRHRKMVAYKDSQNTKRSTKVHGKGAVCCLRIESFNVYIIQLLDTVFVIFRTIKVLVKVVMLRLLLITSTSTLIILDVTETSFNNFFVVYFCTKQLVRGSSDQTDNGHVGFIYYWSLAALLHTYFV